MFYIRVYVFRPLSPCFSFITVSLAKTINYLKSCGWKIKLFYFIFLHHLWAYNNPHNALLLLYNKYWFKQ